MFYISSKKIISNTFVYLTVKYIHAFKKCINISKEEFSLSSYPDNRFSLNYFLLRRKLRNGDKDHHFYFPPFFTDPPPSLSAKESGDQMDFTPLFVQGRGEVKPFQDSF